MKPQNPAPENPAPEKPAPEKPASQSPVPDKPASEQPLSDRAAETRQQILVAACDTIADIGFEKVRMRTVAERAGVSTALLHYHFENRERLFAEALRYTFETSGREEYVATPPDVRPLTWKLARMIESSLPINPELRRDALLWEELWLRAARDEGSRELTVRLYAEARDWFAETIEAGVAAGEFTACDTDAVAEMIIVLTDGYAVHLVFDDPLVELTRAKTEIWALVSARLGISGPFPARDLGGEDRSKEISP